MTINDIVFLAVPGAFLAVAIGVFLHFRRRAAAPPLRRENAGADAPRAGRLGDTYFRAMFPELQPHFHPENVVRLVRDRNGRTDITDGRRWEYPSGFGFAAAQVAMVQGRERIHLFDAAGTRLADVDYEQQAGGGAIRIGRGKLTAVLDVPNNPRVRYWHPEREFKWSRRRGWEFTTPVADRTVESDDRGSRFSGDSSSSSSSSAAAIGAAAAGAVLVSGAGGVFAGGGATESWEGAADGTEARGDSGATAY